MQLPRLGRLQADLWYTRQLLSFLIAKSFGGSAAKGIVDVDVRELPRWPESGLRGDGELLKHPGYTERTVIAAGIMLRASLRLSF